MRHSDGLPTCLLVVRRTGAVTDRDVLVAGSTGDSPGRTTRLADRRMPARGGLRRRSVVP